MTMLATHDRWSTADQAQELRALVGRRKSTASSASSSRISRSLAVVGGKGGVGKSVVALNLGIDFARQGMSVGLLDASHGAGGLGLLCGRNGYWNLEHVIAGTREIADVILDGPYGIHIIPGSRHLATGDLKPSALRDLTEFHRAHDWIIADTGSELSQAITFAAAADRTLIVTTPEPTSVAEAYAAIKQLTGASGATISVLVNEADSEQQARQIVDRLRQAARTFLGGDIGLAGFVPFDPTVGQAVFRRIPLADVDSVSQAQLAIHHIGERLLRTVSVRHERGFFERLQRQQT